MDQKRGGTATGTLYESDDLRFVVSQLQGLLYEYGMEARISFIPQNNGKITYMVSEK
jgi:hypothetical protein